MSGRTLRIGLLALAGLLVAAALGVAASRITSEHVGLYGQPPSVGRELVSGPVQAPGNEGGHKGKQGTGGAAETGENKGPAVPVVEPPPPPVDDDSAAESEAAEQAEDTESHPPEAEEGDSDDD